MVVLPCHRVGAHAFSFLKILPLRSWLFDVRAMMSEIVSGNNHVHIGDIFAGGGRLETVCESKLHLEENSDCTNTCST